MPCRRHQTDRTLCSPQQYSKKHQSLAEGTTESISRRTAVVASVSCRRHSGLTAHTAESRCPGIVELDGL
eukprot:7011690-Heterocapsa_arctica.AAC.1